MIQVVKCPSCSAPLECGEDLFEKCDFCGSKIVVDRTETFQENTFGFDKLLGQAYNLKEILGLARNGRKLEAVKLYRETFGVSLKEAKDAVERLESGQGVNFRNVQFQTSEPIKINSRKLAKTAKRVGFLALIPIFFGVIAGMIGIGGVIFAVYKVTANKTDSVDLTQKVFDFGKQSVAEEILRFGGEGVGAGNFKDNRVVGVDAGGNIYSADYSGNRVQVFDKTGKFLTQWNPKGSQIISSLAVSRKGKVYLARANTISAYDGINGSMLKEVKSKNITRLAVDPGGKVVAIDKDSILVFDENLTSIANYSGLSEKTGISAGFEYIAVNGVGEIYAVPRGKDVCKFSAEGKFLDRFKIKPGSINGIAVDAKDRIFVSETNKVWIYQGDGQELGSFATKQTFGLGFNEQGELLTASRPFIVKYSINLQ